MSARQVIGAAMLLAFAAAVFGLTVATMGLLAAVLIWAGSFATACFLIMAVHLLTE